MGVSKLYYQDIYLGDNELTAIYHGDTKIWRVPFESNAMRRPFMLYVPTAKTFTINGFAVVHPSSAVYDINFGQAGEITLEIPIDGSNEWSLFAPNIIILAPIKWRGLYKSQAFRIYRLVKSMSDAGEKKLVVYARHVFYDMMYSVLRNAVFGERTPELAIKYIFEHQMGYDGTPGDIYNPYFYTLASDAWYSRDGGATVKNFDTEIGGRYNYYEFQESTLVDALIGSSGSIAAINGLELYVDNFYFSLFTHANNVLRGNVKENAFDIRYSFDMMNVSEDINYTNAFTHLLTYDNAKPANEFGVSIAEDAYGPFARPKSVKMSYNNYETGQLVSDTTRYWDDNHDISRSYSAKYAPLHLDESRDFIGQLDGREVGDTGIVRNESIGIVSTNQKIISKRVDLLRDITLEIKLGNAPAQFTKQGAWSDTARSSPPSALEKQIEAMQA